MLRRLSVSDTPSSRAHLPPPTNINEDEKLDAELPEDLVDGVISHDLINEAATTPNGDVYDRRIIEQEISRSKKTRKSLSVQGLRPNRALQAQIDKWKAEHRIHEGA